DGIPDALDPCPNAANLAYNGGSYCVGSIYDINSGALAPGATVVLTNVAVTAVTGSFITVEILPNDVLYQGSSGASLTIHVGLLSAPAVGARVNAIGLVTVGSGF